MYSVTSFQWAKSTCIFCDGKEATVMQYNGAINAALTSAVGGKT
jgi:hypothetical protein